MTGTRRTTESSRRLAGAVFLLLMVSLTGLTLFLVTHLGAEVGQPCVQGALACRSSHGLNSNRCLHTDQEQGYCTLTCERDAECPEGWRCQSAQWGEDGRTEDVCVRP